MTILSKGLSHIIRDELSSIREIIIDQIKTFRLRKQEHIRFQLRDFVALTETQFSCEEALHPMFTTFFAEEKVFIHSEHSRAVENTTRLNFIETTQNEAQK